MQKIFNFQDYSPGRVLQVKTRVAFLDFYNFGFHPPTAGDIGYHPMFKPMPTMFSQDKQNRLHYIKLE